MKPAFLTQPLSKKHVRDQFECGEPSLDRYIREKARQDLKRNIAAVYVLAAEEDSRVLGYYTLSAAGVEPGQFPPEFTWRLPNYDQLPVTLLGRLAVDSSQKGTGLGRRLLMDALRRSLASSDEIASLAVIVDALNESAARFYERYQFVRFPDQEHRLFLPMRTIQTILSAPPPARNV